MNKNLKKKRVLNFIRESGETSRIEISKNLSIDKKTVSVIVDQLLQDALIVPAGYRDSKAGRRQELMRINGSHSNFIGLDLGATHIIGIITDLNGVLLDRVFFEIRPGISVQLILEQLSRITRQLIDSKKKTGTISAIGVCTPGFINPENGISIVAENIPGWHEINMKQLFHDDFKLPLYIEDCSRAYGIAEKWIGKGRNVENFLVLDIGYGIGMAIFVNGQIYSGSCYRSGEIGHTMAVRDGHSCTCGKNGCLETVASGKGLARLAREGMKQGKSSVLNQLTHGNEESVTAQDVALAASMNDEFSKDLLNQAGSYLGEALANAVNLINPSKVIIGGGLIGAGKMFIDEIQSSLIKNTMSGLLDDLEFTLSEAGVDGSAYGCAFLAMDHIFSA